MSNEFIQVKICNLDEIHYVTPTCRTFSPLVGTFQMEATKSQMNRLAVLITRSGYPIAALRGMPSILRAAFASMLNMGRVGQALL